MAGSCLGRGVLGVVSVRVFGARADPVSRSRVFVLLSHISRWSPFRCWGCGHIHGGLCPHTFCHVPLAGYLPADGTPRRAPDCGGEGVAYGHMPGRGGSLPWWGKANPWSEGAPDAEPHPNVMSSHFGPLEPDQGLAVTALLQQFRSRRHHVKHQTVSEQCLSYPPRAPRARARIRGEVGWL
jgi:hypothetical protein